MYPTFKSTTMTKAVEQAITRRARLLCTLDHGDLAVLLARLEYEARKMRDALNLRDEEDNLVEQRAIARASDELAQAVAAIDALVAS